MTKKGSTALHAYLREHRSQFGTSRRLAAHAEETQFFSDEANYARGVDSYLDLFEHHRARVQQQQSFIIFEKSATYFTEPRAPMRLKSLLPHDTTKLVVITIDPADRAYSWYQHARHHNDSAALAHSFHEIVALNLSTSIASAEAARRLRRRCLDPGVYHKHLRRWLIHFSARQLHIVDGEALRTRPAQLMHELQRFAGLSGERVLDYARLLEYDAQKRFFCFRRGLRGLSEPKRRCLGSSKGRRYPPMAHETRALLRAFYTEHNALLLHMLKRYRLNVPGWLESNSSSSSRQT